MLIVRVHKVNFHLNPRKHTVFFANQAEMACAERLRGFCNPGSLQAVLCESLEDGVELLRQDLAKSILSWDPKADLGAFTFNVADEVIKDGRCYSDFQVVNGTNYRVEA